MFQTTNQIFLGLNIHIAGAHVVVDPNLILHHGIDAIGSTGAIGCQTRLKNHLPRAPGGGWLYRFSLERNQTWRKSLKNGGSFSGKSWEYSLIFMVDEGHPPLIAGG